MTTPCAVLSVGLSTNRDLPGCSGPLRGADFALLGMTFTRSGIVVPELLGGRVDLVRRFGPLTCSNTYLERIETVILDRDDDLHLLSRDGGERQE